MDKVDEEFKRKVLNKLTKIDVPSMHSQHQQLVEYIIEIAEVMIDLRKRKPTDSELESVSITVKKVENYLANHLNEEEEFLRSINYPEIESHKMAHEKFKKEFFKVKENMDKVGVQYIVDLYYLIYSWLFDHINYHDVKYSKFYLENK